MSIFACVLEESPVRLWGLGSKERLRRQIREAGRVEFVTTLGELPGSGQILLLNGNYLFELKTLTELIKRPATVLVCPSDGRPAAALVEADMAKQVAQYMLHNGTVAPGESNSNGFNPERVNFIRPDDITAFSDELKSASPPLLEKISPDRKEYLESLLYGNAYKGITDLVTKFLWPRPARKAVRLCAGLGLSPNMVTTAGLVLVILACWAFLNGHYLSGLLAGWMMTFLDTVDGKLARVTIQSSRFGNWYDHGIDLFHPPFWYIYWGMSLLGFQSFLGFDQQNMYWMIVIGYVLGRVVEGIFPLLGDCSMFTWRPFDAWFRLVTARRNPCLILLTLSVLTGRPDWGFIAVTWWTVLTTMVLIFRLGQGVFVRVTQGPLTSWLSARDVATGSNAGSYRIFGATRGAYESQ